MERSLGRSTFIRIKRGYSTSGTLAYDLERATAVRQRSFIAARACRTKRCQSVRTRARLGTGLKFRPPLTRAFSFFLFVFEAGDALFVVGAEAFFGIFALEEQRLQFAFERERVLAAEARLPIWTLRLMWPTAIGLLWAAELFWRNP